MRFPKLTSKKLNVTNMENKRIFISIFKCGLTRVDQIFLLSFFFFSILVGKREGEGANCIVYYLNEVLAIYVKTF